MLVANSSPNGRRTPPAAAAQARFRIYNLEPGEGFEPPTRALRERCSLSHLAPHSPYEPHFVSENGLYHPTAAQPVTPSADKFVGKLSATIGGAGETLGPANPTPFMRGQMPGATYEDYRFADDPSTCWQTRPSSPYSLP